MKDLREYVGKIVLREDGNKAPERLYCIDIDDNVLIIKDKNNNKFRTTREEVVLFGRPFADDFEKLGIPKNENIRHTIRKDSK